MKPAPFNPPVGEPPVLRMCTPSELRIDPAYQRGMQDKRSAELVKRIAREWNWGLCLPLVVARRVDLTERLFVIDGQHRLEAARLRGDIAELPCVVGDYDSVADEAAGFVALNRNRKPLTKLDLFRAAVASGEERAAAIHAAILDAGLSLAPHDNNRVWKPGMISHIGGIERVWNRDGPLVTERALHALAQGFAGHVQTYGGTLYRAIARVCRGEIRQHGEFRGERFERFILMLARQPQADWVDAFKRRWRDGTEMFQAEAADNLLQEEWRRVWAKSPAQPAPLAEVSWTPGEDDDLGEAKRIWCAQCDRRVTEQKAAACLSKFCPLKAAA